MDAPQNIPEPQILTDLLGILAKVLAAFGAIIITGMSYVWSVARSAKLCAFDARIKVERADANAEMMTKAVDGLRNDMTKGFRGIHERQDRHMEQH